MLAGWEAGKEDGGIPELRLFGYAGNLANTFGCRIVNCSHVAFGMTYFLTSERSLPLGGGKKIADAAQKISFIRVCPVPAWVEQRGSGWLPFPMVLMGVVWTARSELPLLPHLHFSLQNR